MANTFRLDFSTLASGAFQIVPVDLNTGALRSVQFRFEQAGLNEDIEVHYFELHFTMGGVSKELL